MLTSKLKLKRIHCKNDDDDITGTFVALCKISKICMKEKKCQEYNIIF